MSNEKTLSNVVNGGRQEGKDIPDWLEIVRSKVEGLRFGVVQISVHNSNVVQIERTERLRIENLEKTVRS